jgi:hypothetical protein
MSIFSSSGGLEEKQIKQKLMIALEEQNIYTKSHLFEGVENKSVK